MARRSRQLASQGSTIPRVCWRSTGSPSPVDVHWGISSSIPRDCQRSAGSQSLVCVSEGTFTVLRLSPESQTTSAQRRSHRHTPGTVFYASLKLRFRRPEYVSKDRFQLLFFRPFRVRFHTSVVSVRRSVVRGKVRSPTPVIHVSR